jgi:hypothetical protein
MRRFATISLALALGLIAIAAVPVVAAKVVIRNDEMLSE